MTIALHLVVLPDTYTRLALWGEFSRDCPPPGFHSHSQLHEHAIHHTYLRETLDDIGVTHVDSLSLHSLILWLPSHRGYPLPGYRPEDSWASAVQDSTFAPYDVPVIELDPLALLTFLEHYHQEFAAYFTTNIPDIVYWNTAYTFAHSLTTRQQFVPGLRKTDSAHFEACWEPYPSPEVTDFIQHYSVHMPASSRAAQKREKTLDHPPTAHPPTILRNILVTLVDALVRRTALPARQQAVTRFRSPLIWSYAQRQYIAPTATECWRDALQADHKAVIEASPRQLQALFTKVTAWHQKLEKEAAQRLGQHRHRYHWCFRLCDMVADAHGQLSLSNTEDGPVHWMLLIELHDTNNPDLRIPFDQVWTRSAPELQDLPAAEQTELIAQLGKVLPLVPALEPVLQHNVSLAMMELSTEEAYHFLTRAALDLQSAGQSVELPAWWKNEKRRPRLQATIQDPISTGLLGMDTLLTFEWNIALGDDSVTAAELAQLAHSKQSLVRFRGRWMQVDHEAIQLALRRLEQRPSGTIAVRDALSMTLTPPPNGTEAADPGQWLQSFLTQLRSKASFGEIAPPRDLQITLRPYQTRGYAWLSFLTQFGFGALLADEMGLGKTLMTLALIGKHWEELEHRPSLVVAPVTAIDQWREEAERSLPTLPVVIYHGTNRDETRSRLEQAGIVLTSYAILQRDSAILREISWRAVIADEAQQIKNANTNHARAIRLLPSAYRIALTGTPIENSALDLWSIFDWLNHEYLGSQSAFVRTFITAHEKVDQQQAAEHLRQLIAPFLLRRMKTDPAIAPDLPPMIEQTTRCLLTREQAALYAAAVDNLAQQLTTATSMQRRGLILAALTHFKQICASPALFLKDNSTLAGRSGKIERLEELLDEMMADNERGLIFTQFATFARLLQAHLAARFHVPVFCLDGQTPERERAELRTAFQAGEAPIFILSLKAGGSAITLTAASQVFHVDRWWNPASEDQASGRAHRIGQTQTVTVHRMVCQGTIEERIDQLQAGKRVLAAGIIPTGEQQLTELDTETLLDLVRLRPVEGVD